MLEITTFVLHAYIMIAFERFFKLVTKYYIGCILNVMNVLFCL